jgi:hypothetical protein
MFPGFGIMYQGKYGSPDRKIFFPFFSFSFLSFLSRWKIFQTRLKTSEEINRWNIDRLVRRNSLFPTFKK